MTPRPKPTHPTDIREDDPRLRAAQEAIDRARARRPGRPPVEPGPDFRHVHIPDAPPGQEGRLVEVKHASSHANEGAQGWAWLVVVITALVALGPLILNVLSSLAENWHHIPHGFRTLFGG